ncbi:MAG: sugar ABC transporter ATP-binding protein [Planctomycetaceae bacterium]|nr:sugar ABC transporter ATP-binding protein [Planctomycetaceae bacterium]
MPERIVMSGISKRFPGVVALDNVRLSVQPGEVHAVVGENGAGKSTLMKILAGAYEKDGGRLFLDGNEVDIRGPLHAQELGIAIIYQNLNMVPDLTAAENIFIGRFPRRGRRIDYRSMNARAATLLSEVGARFSPGSVVGALSLADRQLVAIAKALSFAASVVVMDEPTSSLTPAEVEMLFGIVRKITSAGASVIFISHHMEEIFSITDRVTVLRDGRLVGSWDTRDLTEESLVGHMIGRPVDNLFPKDNVPSGEKVLEVRGLSAKGLFEDVSFSLRKGEILGIGGLVGSGRTELVKTIFGDIPRSAGSVRVDGREVNIRSPMDAVKAGMALVPEDRGGEGALLDDDVCQNISLPVLRKYFRRGRLDRASERSSATSYIESLRIKTPSPEQRVENLSGGNQQKVVLAKWFETRPKILILDEPTRGIDVGAKAEIYRLISEMAARGVGVLMISSELPELMGLSDRVLVMCRGRLATSMDRDAATSERVMLAAAGGKL